MGLFSKLLGPASKYDKSLPYTYEARVPIMEGDEEFNSYLSDTICGLIEYLEKNDIKPKDVDIFEVYQNEEKIIRGDLYTSEQGEWLYRPEICQCFEKHYAGHIYKGGCSFRDRDRAGIGP